MIMTHPLSIFITLLPLLSQLHQTNAVYRVYICRRELQSYFQNSPHLDTIKDHHIDIIRNNESKVSEDGSLMLTVDAVASGSGSPSMMLEPTDQSLPPLPAEVDTIAISWHANIEVLYNLSFTEDPVGYFSTVDSNITTASSTTVHVAMGELPRQRSGFTLYFPCHSSSDGEGRLLVNLTTTVVSTNHVVDANFHITKICERNETIQPTPSRSFPLSSMSLSRSFSSLLSLPSQLFTSSQGIMSQGVTLSPSPFTTFTPSPSPSTTLTPPQVTTSSFTDFIDFDVFTSDIVMSLSNTPSAILTTSDSPVLLPLSTLQLEPSSFSMYSPSMSDLLSSSTPSGQPSSSPLLSVATTSSLVLESTSTITESSTTLVLEPTSTITESSLVLESTSTVTESSATLVLESTPTITESSTSLVLEPTPTITESSLVLESTSTVTESSTTLVLEPTPTITESSLVLESTPTVTESSTTLVLEPMPTITESSLVLESTPTVTESSTTLVLEPTPTITESSLVLESTPTVTESSTTLVLEPTPTITESSLVLESTPTVTESSTSLVLEPTPTITESSLVLESTPTITESSTSLVLEPTSTVTESSTALVLESMPTITESSTAALISTSSFVATPTMNVMVPPTVVSVMSSSVTLSVTSIEVVGSVSISQSLSSTFQMDSSEVFLPLSTSDELSTAIAVSPSTSVFILTTPVLSSSMLPLATPVVFIPTPSLSVSSRPLTSSPVTVSTSSSVPSESMLELQSSTLITPSRSLPLSSTVSSQPLTPSPVTVSESSSVPSESVLELQSTLITPSRSFPLSSTLTPSPVTVSATSAPSEFQRESQSTLTTQSLSASPSQPTSQQPMSSPSTFSASSSGVDTATSLPSLSPTVNPTGLFNDTDVERESQLLELMIIVFAPVVGILIISITILVCFIICVSYRRRKPPTKCFSDDPLDMPVSIYPGGGFVAAADDDLEDSMKKNEPPLSLWMSLSWGTVAHLPASIQSISKHYNIDRRSLTILSTVTRGEFGSIVNGQLSMEGSEDGGGGYNGGVMMKLLTGFENKYGHRDEVTKFLERATLLRGMDHPNIQCVLKVSVEDNYIPIVVYPIVEYGNLHNFLEFCRLTPTESPLNGAFAQYQRLLRSNTVLPVTLHHKLNFALQIANAMNHLSKNGIVHPDLALRNCLLDTNYTVKVADGALAQQNYPECYYTVYGTVRPVRWAAIETLQEGLCTAQSNVWSYGVTVWEVMSLAELPYSDIDNNRSILSQLMMDTRLPQPDSCPDNLYSLMMNCWKKRAEERPNFATLFSQLQQMTDGPRPPPTTTYVRIPSVDIEQFDREPESFATNTDPSYLRQSTGSISRLSPKVSQRALNRYSSEQLSLTFSVLSCDTQGDEEDSIHSSDNEDDTLSPLMMAPLFTSGLERGDQVAPINAHQGPNNLMSTFHSVDELELQTSSSSRLAGHASPTTPSTVQTWLTPFDSASYSSRRETLRSDDTASTQLPPMSSPSPDLTSKTSTIGDETMSTISNTNVTHNNTEDSVSKRSSLVIDSGSVSTLATPASSVITTGRTSRISAPELQHSGLVNGSTTKSPLFAHHSKTNGNAVHYSTPNSDTRDASNNGNTHSSNSGFDSERALNKHERTTSNGVHDEKKNPIVDTNFEPTSTLADEDGGGLGMKDSGGLGIDFSDLSSAFESWNLSS